MGGLAISDCLLTDLKIIPKEGGNVLHALKKTDDGFRRFEEAYFSTIDEGHTTDWKLHKQMTLNLVVPSGKIKFALFDDRHGSTSKGKFEELVLGENNYCRLTVPPNIWMAFQGVGESLNILLNIADQQHDPGEVERRADSEFDYYWNKMT